MDVGFDHVTLAVTDLDAAKRFFALLGFEESQAVVVSGPSMSAYMGIDGWESDHVTMRHAKASTHQEVQLLRFRSPKIQVDTETGNLARTGFNHVCFRIDDLDATLDELRANGVSIRNDLLEFHDRRLIFIDGPDGVVIELAQWKREPS
jgi:catechol 2,3-dioxygenase-like lactoylglutathione lyase family enzyme